MTDLKELLRDFLIVFAIAIVAVGAMFLAIKSANAQTYNLQLENKYASVYESLSGVIVVSDNECDVPDYKPVELHYFNNPADSSFGPLFDNFTYLVSEPAIVDGEIVYQEVTRRCDVYGVARLRDTGTEPARYYSRSVYDIDSACLHVYQTELWTMLQDTQETVAYARLCVREGVFILDELQE